MNSCLRRVWFDTNDVLKKFEGGIQVEY